jgi:HlyD family secretion protein
MDYGRARASAGSRQHGFLWKLASSCYGTGSRSTVSASAPIVVFASAGRVEGLSETTEVGAAADGVLKAIYVKEDEFVKKGTVLGEIACDDLTPVLQTAQAEADAARHSRARLVRGTREEEKRVATRKTAAARATYQEAKARLGRQRALYKDGEIARSVYDQAVRDLGVTQAEYQAAVRTEQLLAAPPVREDKARADAEVVAAEAHVQGAQERLRKCSIIAPIDGTVLRVYARPGESFSTVTPRPLFSLADASGRRVKAEVDERDFGKVAVGQNVIIHADGLNGARLTGSVARVSAIMGRKTVYSGDPADKSDRDVLEVTIDLKDNAQSLLSALESPSNSSRILHKNSSVESSGQTGKSTRCCIAHSGSLGSLNRSVSLMLPCPNCGKLTRLRFPGSRFEAVSSGGKMINELRNASIAA